MHQVRNSGTHGLGAFAKQDIPAGTVLGRYPGRIRTPEEMAAKAFRSPGAKDYCWLNERGNYIDPTDSDGKVSTLPGPGSFWCFPVDITLTRVNEPPIGQASINLASEDVDNGHGIQYVAARDIIAGEELFIDYGMNYDRSKYGS